MVFNCNYSRWSCTLRLSANNNSFTIEERTSSTIPVAIGPDAVRHTVRLGSISGGMWDKRRSNLFGWRRRVPVRDGLPRNTSLWATSYGHHLFAPLIPKRFWKKHHQFSISKGGNVLPHNFKRPDNIGVCQRRTVFAWRQSLLLVFSIVDQSKFKFQEFAIDCSQLLQYGSL